MANTKAIGELYNTSKHDISYHLKNIFNDYELAENSVVKNYLTTANDGKNYKTNYYNLDAVLSVGYRVNSLKATQTFIKQQFYRIRFYIYY